MKNTNAIISLEKFIKYYTHIERTKLLLLEKIPYNRSLKGQVSMMNKKKCIHLNNLIIFNDIQEEFFFSLTEEHIHLSTN